MKRVERLEDMSVRGRLRLLRQDDGDIIVAVQSEENGLLQPGDSVEFCMPGTGGGKSPRTLAALRALMVAMAEDNAADTSRAPNVELTGNPAATDDATAARQPAGVFRLSE